VDLRCTALSLCALAAPALGQVAPPNAPPGVYEVTVRERRPVTASSEYMADAEDLALRRLDTPEQVIESVPPLLGAQHAGGGKANQYFVRGFDADHGTDIAFFVDGLPTNLRSHAHGQGFNDLHFVIPETIERVEAHMGPYHPEFGDFDTAGAVNLRLLRRAPEPFVSFSGGQYDAWRAVALISPRSGAFAGDEPEQTLLGAVEVNTADGPFHLHENYWAYKGLVRYGRRLSERTLVDAWLSLYAGQWNASGQIPQRLVREPGFDRWDAVDPKGEGGDTDRESLLLRLVHRPSDHGQLEAVLWGAHYALDLYSNFTLFLNDPANGDGIVQSDDRVYFGGTLVYRHALDVLARPTVLSAGLDTRTDLAGVQLARQRSRDRLGPVSHDEVHESSLAGFAQAEVLLLPWIRFLGGLRIEGFRLGVENRDEDETGPRAGGHVTEDVYLPKANLIFAPFSEAGPFPSNAQALRSFQLFLNYGVGFHSNDARDVVANPREPTLPRATGFEVGARATLFEGFDLALSYWWLDLEREFVFVGDEGTTEVNPRSRRRGLELAGRLDLLEWVYAEVALAWSSASFENGDAVPQAPRLIGKAALRVDHPSGISAELSYRAAGQRYAVEDRSVRLSGYGIVDFGLRYRRGPFEIQLTLENVTNRSWRQSEFYYTSRLPFEPADGVDDFHFTPGNPRNLQIGMRWYY
jgi:hypothetical protein